jgi:hypothetical protein
MSPLSSGHRESTVDQKSSKLSFPIVASVLALILLAGAFALPKIPQAQSYHNFADQAEYWGIPHASNVLSNLAFLLVGLYGVFKRPRYSHGRDVLLGLVTFWVGIFLITLGSSYYHWAPSDDTLLWDRLPMSMAFMGVSYSLIAAQGRLKLYVIPYLFMEALGVSSTLYAHLAGDLSFYAMCQAYPLLLALISAIRLWPMSGTKDLLWGFLAYGLAKVFEYNDLAVFELSAEQVSGHTIKHVLAALGAFFVLRFFMHLKPAEALDVSPAS